MFNINSTRIVAWTVIMLFTSACQPNLSTSLPLAPTEPDVLQAPASPDPAKPLLKTAQGDFVIASARLVDEANGVKPQAGEKILLVILTQPDLENLDPGKFSLEDFNNMVHDPTTEAYILGNDGSQTISTIGGWVGDEFAMGFRVPVDINTYTLYWTGNTPIPLRVEE